MPSSVGGKSKKGRRSAHNKQTGKYARQHSRTERNKRKKWQKHLDNNPNLDKDTVKMLESKITQSKIGRVSV
jgi:hypothetical protein